MFFILCMFVILKNIYNIVTWRREQQDNAYL